MAANKRKTTTVVTSGNVRIEEPPQKKRRKSRPSVIDSADDFAGGFVAFLRKNAVVGLAVGFVIGTQAQLLVKQLVSSFIDPLFQLLFGQALSARTFTLHFHGRISVFSWGAFAYALLNFLFVLLAIYVIIKLFSLDKLDKKEKE